MTVSTINEGLNWSILGLVGMAKMVLLSGRQMILPGSLKLPEWRGKAWLWMQVQKKSH